MNRLLFLLEKYAVTYFFRILAVTMNISEINTRPDFQCLYLFWHRNLLPLMHLHRHREIVILISPSKDGELIAGPASLNGYKVVRGSSSKKSFSALRELLQLAGKHSLALTPDGPLGPRETVKESAIFIAYKTGLPIVCTAVDIDKEWVFRTWDSFRVPKPFSKVKVSYSEPYYIHSKDDMQNKRLTIQQHIDRLTAENRDSQYHSK